MTHLDAATLEAGLPQIRQAPKDEGRVALIVRRPTIDEREVLDEAEIDLVHGVVGDNWRVKGSSSTPDGSANPDAQITVVNARAAAVVAGDVERWPLAGDQLYVDLDISTENLPPGTRLELGTAVLEVTAKPHTGCAKFASRFGKDALRFVNTGEGRQLNLRGINTKVVTPGVVRVGDAVRKAPAPVAV
jgi:MOSC domain-containing protein YiiM